MIKMHMKKTMNEQAAYWLEEIESATLTAKKCKLFEAWITEKEEHRDCFEEIARLSMDMPSLSNDLGRENYAQSEELEAAIIEAQELAAVHKTQKKKYILRRSLGSIAASLLILCTGFWFWQMSPFVDQPVLYATAVGEQRTVMLQDGSVVTLNTNSEISVAMTSGIRRLHLKKGEVFFEVAKDKSRPFEVAVKNAFVKAVGTAFNIREQGDQVTVLVTEGEVEVKSSFTPLSDLNASSLLSEKKENLVAGDQIIFGRDKLKREKLAVTMMNRRILWRKGHLVFEGETLTEIVAKLQPYISEKIIISDEKTKNLIAGGVFKVGEINSFFKVLETVLPVEIIRENGAIILTSYANVKDGEKKL